MEKTIRLIQVVSPGKYVQDMLLITLFLVFFYQETTYPLPYLTLMSILLIAITATLLYRKFPYSTGSAVFLTLLFHSFILIFGGSIILYLIVSALSIWRLQSRFGTVQFEGAYDLPFIAKMAVLYVLLAAASIFFGFKHEVALLSGLLIISLILSVGTRLIEQWSKADPLNDTKRGMITLFVSITGIGVAAYLFIRYLGSLIREGFEWVLLKVLALFLPFIGILIEQPIDWLRSLIAARKSEEETPTPVTQGNDEREPFTLPTGSEANFPWVPVLMVVAIAFFVFIVLQMMKRRREFEKVESLHHEIERDSTWNFEEHTKGDWMYSMDSHIVREAFIRFEAEALESGVHRNQEETVREWFKRMEWKADSRFFSIYDSVRYGAGKVPEVDGKWFLQHLNEIKLKFLKKDV